MVATSPFTSNPLSAQNQFSQTFQAQQQIIRQQQLTQVRTTQQQVKPQVQPQRQPQDPNKVIAEYQGHKLLASGKITGIIPTLKEVWVEGRGFIKVPTGAPEGATRAEVIAAGYGAARFENIERVLRGEAKDIGEATKQTTLAREAAKRAAGIAPEQLGKTETQKIKEMREGFGKAFETRGTTLTQADRDFLAQEKAQISKGVLQTLSKPFLASAAPSQTQTAQGMTIDQLRESQRLADQQAVASYTGLPLATVQKNWGTFKKESPGYERQFEEALEEAERTGKGYIAGVGDISITKTEKKVKVQPVEEYTITDFVDDKGVSSVYFDSKKGDLKTILQGVTLAAKTQKQAEAEFKPLTKEELSRLPKIELFGGRKGTEEEIEKRVLAEGTLVQELQARFEKSIGIPQIDFYPIKGIKELSTEVSSKVRGATGTVAPGPMEIPIKVALYGTAGITSIPEMLIDLPEFAGKTIVASKGIAELGLSGEKEALKKRARGSAVQVLSVATDPAFYVESAGAVLGFGLAGKVLRGGRPRVPKVESVDVLAFVETEAKIKSNILKAQPTPKGLGKLPATPEQILKMRIPEPATSIQLTGKARGYVKGPPELSLVDRITGKPPKQPLLGEFDIKFVHEKYAKPQKLPSLAKDIVLQDIESVTKAVGEAKVKGKKIPINLKQYTKSVVVEPAFEYDIQTGRFLGGKKGVPDIFKKQAIPEVKIPQPQKLSFTYTVQKGKPISETFGYSKQTGTLQTRLGEAAITEGELFKLKRPKRGEPKLGKPTTARGITFDVRGKTPRSIDYYLRELSLKEAKEGFEKAVKRKKARPPPEERIQLPKETMQQLITKTEQLYIEAPFKPPKGAIVFGDRIFAVPKVAPKTAPKVEDKIFAVPRTAPKAAPSIPSKQVEIKQAGGMVQLQKTIQKQKTITKEIQKQQQITQQKTIQKTKVAAQQKFKEAKQLTESKVKQVEQIYPQKIKFRGMNKVAQITMPKQVPITRQAPKALERIRQKQREGQKQRQPQEEIITQLDFQAQLEKPITTPRTPQRTRITFREPRITITPPPTPIKTIPPTTPKKVFLKPPKLFFEKKKKEKKKKKIPVRKFKPYKISRLADLLSVSATERYVGFGKVLHQRTKKTPSFLAEYFPTAQMRDWFARAPKNKKRKY